MEEPSYDLVADLVRDHVHLAPDLAKFRGVDRKRREDAPMSAAIIIVTSETHLRGAIKLAGPFLRELTIQTSPVFGVTPRPNNDDIAGLDALAPNSVRVCIRGVLQVSQQTSPFIQCWSAIAAKPAVRELRLECFFCDTNPAIRLINNPKVVITDTLMLDNWDLLGSVKTANCILRHNGVSMLAVHCSHIPPLLMERTCARTILLKLCDYDPAVASALGANPHVKFLMFSFAYGFELIALALLLMHPHDYSNGLRISYRGAPREDAMVAADPEVGRALIAALTSPNLRIGTALEVSTAFATSNEGDDDDLFTAIASCASRNKALWKLIVNIYGVPSIGFGTRSLLRLPKHIKHVTLCVREPNWMKADVRYHAWLWEALLGVDLPGATTLILNIHFGFSEHMESVPDLLFHDAGNAIACGAPNLCHLRISFVEPYNVAGWVEPLCKGFSTAALPGTLTRSDRTVAWKRTPQ